MGNINDLLVTYKKVEVPESSPISFTPPESRYDRLLSFIRLHKSTNTENTSSLPTVALPTELSAGDEWHWTLSPDYGLIYTKSGVDPEFKLDKNQWVKALTTSYRKLGLSDNAIKNLIAKNALESGWGQKTLGKHNYGNITTGASWTGDYVDGSDHDANGNRITNRFRSYLSMDDFAKDELQFLTTLYDFDPNDDIDTFTRKLLGGNKGKRKYAESRSYKQDVKKVYDSI